MTYSDDDYPPFAGDQTGQLLAEPDIVALSPVTSARVVETQSGYLVVLKKVDDRLSLSVKRRIGTPPSSNVMLTPDESIQLSRVLTDSVETLSDVPGDFLVRELAQRTARTESSLAEDQELSTIYGESGNRESGKLDWDEIKQPWRKRKAQQNSQGLDIAGSELTTDRGRSLPIKNILIGAGVVGLAAAAIIGIIAFAGSSFNDATNAGKPTSSNATKAAGDAMAPDNVDKFVRNFVANMLDFNPRTYRSSQVQAMAVMKPRLLERYWQETSFPLSKSKLRSQHRDQTLIINKVLQQPTSSVSTDVEMAADLSTPGQTESTPVRLQIDLGLDRDGQLVVTDIKDASSKIEARPDAETSEKAESAEEQSTE